MKAIRAKVIGKVQGVGYRMWAEHAARASGLSGSVRNLRDGSVEVIVAGEDSAVAAFLDACRRGPRHSVVEDVVQSDTDWTGTGFTILPTG
jgi:acylphosphatase